jgi:hypothetical protein
LSANAGTAIANINAVTSATANTKSMRFTCYLLNCRAGLVGPTVLRNVSSSMTVA